MAFKFFTIAMLLSVLFYGESLQAKLNLSKKEVKLQAETRKLMKDVCAQQKNLLESAKIDGKGDVTVSKQEFEKLKPHNFDYKQYHPLADGRATLFAERWAFYSALLDRLQKYPKKKQEQIIEQVKKNISHKDSLYAAIYDFEQHSYPKKNPYLPEEMIALRQSAKYGADPNQLVCDNGFAVSLVMKMISDFKKTYRKSNYWDAMTTFIDHQQVDGLDLNAMTCVVNDPHSKTGVFWKYAKTPSSISDCFLGNYQNHDAFIFYNRYPELHLYDKSSFDIATNWDMRETAPDRQKLAAAAGVDPLSSKDTLVLDVEPKESTDLSLKKLKDGWDPVRALFYNMEDCRPGGLTALKQSGQFNKTLKKIKGNAKLKGEFESKCINLYRSYSDAKFFIKNEIKDAKHFKQAQGDLAQCISDVSGTSRRLDEFRSCRKAYDYYSMSLSYGEVLSFIDLSFKAEASQFVSQIEQLNDQFGKSFVKSTESLADLYQTCGWTYRHLKDALSEIKWNVDCESAEAWEKLNATPSKKTIVDKKIKKPLSGIRTQ